MAIRTNGHPESTPASSTPTIDISLDRLDSDADAQPTFWQHRLSASFAAMADQIAATSQALARIPSNGAGLRAELSTLKTRLEDMERTQERLEADVEAFRNRGEAQEGGKLEALEKKLATLSETVLLDQQRLPARLHNARATVMKAPLMPLVMANGKPAPGFPSTRGEFEHITKERYEALLKAYGLPLQGDTAAKRETLRTFAGMPQDGQ